MTRRAIVIGGGPAGIKAAHELVKSGAEVTLLESAPVLGGLASAFDVQGVRIERYYHFICKGDDHLVETLEELSLSHKLHWRDSRMAYFVDGRLYPFLTPIELLKFRALPLHDRLRAGAAVKLAQRMREEDLAPLKATAWLRRMFGERSYRVIWEPLMRFKFSEHADEVSAAWIWARMVRLGRSRTSAWREELGYIEGGSATVIDALAADFVRRGGRIVLNAPVEQILIEGGRATGVRVGGETVPAEAVVSTVTTSRFRQLAQGVDGSYIQGLERIPTIGIFCLFLRLTERVTPFFWVNTHDP
ncbi:MAG TPA: FAD-dependent oxidoreductase, partial [Vicinamibacteria bacterium]|nr:FAD-dependent oxidoreductase [Vicinamibacteria bacterium]